MLQPVAIQPDRVRQLLDAPSWCMQQKYDGVRCQITCRDGRIAAASRVGSPIDIGDLIDEFPTDRGDYVLDGEVCQPPASNSPQSVYFPFDELSAPHSPYEQRLSRAAQIVQQCDSPRIRKVRTWRTSKHKMATLRRLHDQRAEGAIFRALAEPYYPGRDDNVACRFDFRNRCEVVVIGLQVGERAIRLGQYDAQRMLVEVGQAVLPGTGPDSPWRQVSVALEKYGPGKCVAEIEYRSVTATGELVACRFVRIRQDKRPTPVDCPNSPHRQQRGGEPGSWPLASGGDERYQAAESRVDGMQLPHRFAKTTKKTPSNWAIVPWLLFSILCALFALAMWFLGSQKMRSPLDGRRWR